jgi:hypothetical protein
MVEQGKIMLANKNARSYTCIMHKKTRQDTQ